MPYAKGAKPGDSKTDRILPKLPPPVKVPKPVKD
jgi:hypothetical protein